MIEGMSWRPRQREAPCLSIGRLSAFPPSFEGIRVCRLPFRVEQMVTDQLSPGERVGTQPGAIQAASFSGPSVRAG